MTMDDIINDKRICPVCKKETDWLKTMEKPAEGSIYYCDGPFKFEEYGFEEEDY